MKAEARWCLHEPKDRYSGEAQEVTRRLEEDRYRVILEEMIWGDSGFEGEAGDHTMG